MKAFGSAFREVQERAPDFSNVHDIFEILRGVHFVAAHRERLEKSRELLDRNVVDNTERGLKLTLAAVSWAHVEQTKLYQRFIAFFNEVDVLICPAASVSPFPHGQLFIEEINGEKMPTYMRWLAITYAPTMALACAAVLPCGVDRHGMPFGIQVIGRTAPTPSCWRWPTRSSRCWRQQGDGATRAGSGEALCVSAARERSGTRAQQPAKLAT